MCLYLLGHPVYATVALMLKIFSIKLTESKIIL